MDLEYDRFVSSSSFGGNASKPTSKCSFISWSVLFSGILLASAVLGVLYVFNADSKENNFDELVMTGGSVRSLEASNNEFVCNTPLCHRIATYVNNSMNKSVDPCEDFFAYACGGWIKQNPIPKTSSTFSTFSKLNQEVEKKLRRILESDSKSNIKVLRKVKDFYRSCMDMKSINARGSRPMLELIDYLQSWAMFDTWKEKEWDLQDVLLKIHQEFTSSGGPLFSVHVSDDPVHSTKHIIEIDQAGPGLPKEIYKAKKKTLQAYEEYLVDVAKLLKSKGDVKKMAKEVIEFEKALADISISDDNKTDTWFHSMKMDELEKAVPDFPWKSYINRIFEGRTVISGNETLIVPALKYLEKMMGVVRSTPKRILSNYIVWSVIQDEVPYLSKPFQEARMHYKEKILGSKGLRKRWKTCVSYTNEYLGEILGTLYIKDNFSTKNQRIAENMIKNIRNAFKDNVKTLGWMDYKTKRKVEEKADAMRDQVGFPKYIYNWTRFEDKYHNLTILSNDLFKNRINMIKFAHNRMLNKLRKEVDKDEWPMDPQTVNAMYSFNENGMIIPAGILQPPFFQGENVSMAMQYGALGSILGHELTHGFDNTGRKFNKHGELRKQWWTNKSLEGFVHRSKCMENQYSKYQVRGKYKINGKLTLGENIADNGGFKTSLRAYHNWLKNTGKDLTLPGLEFSPDQLFHLAFAQAYCSNSRPNEQYLATLNDRHAEEEFRVIGTLSNSKEFAAAYNCKKDSRMNPTKKCYIWVDDDEIIESDPASGE